MNFLIDVFQGNRWGTLLFFGGVTEFKWFDL